MVSIAGQKRKHPSLHGQNHRHPRKTEQVVAYHSSSEEDGTTAADRFLADDFSDRDGEGNTQLSSLQAKNLDVQRSDSGEDASDITSQEELENSESSISDAGTDEVATNDTGIKRKRNDPTRLATSISSILGSKLTTGQRADPVLSRSAAASNVSKEVSESRLEAKARRKLRDEKRRAMERGRVKDVLGLEDTNVSTAEVAEQEKQLRKIAQRGVVKLFNAVRAAQVKGEQTAREAGGLVAGGTETGIIGADRRKEKINEMSKQGFLDLLAGGAV